MTVKEFIKTVWDAKYEILVCRGRFTNIVRDFVVNPADVCNIGHKEIEELYPLRVSGFRVFPGDDHITAYCLID